MNHFMFDIDGTLVESYAFDSECFVSAVRDVLHIDINSDWSSYSHVTDAGILEQILETYQITNKPHYRAAVKRIFLKKIAQYIATHPVSQIVGANEFLQHLKTMENVSLSLATGGWCESAVLKLQSAGIDFSGIPMASANDHFDRVEIMKLAAARSAYNTADPVTYFGDGIWDKEACEKLGFNFVLVGSRLDYQPRIENFKTMREFLLRAGLEGY